MALENVTLDGIILFRDDMSLNGELVLYNIIRNINGINVLTINEREKTLKQRYPTKLQQATFVHFTDSSSVSSILQTFSSSKYNLILIDSFELLIELLGADQCALLLHKLKGLSTCIATLCSSSTISSSQWLRISSVANSTFIISSRNGTSLVESKIYKKNGKMQTTTESFSLNDGKLVCKKLEKDGVEETIQSLNTDLQTQFDMGFNLKESEKLAKDAVQLPYMDAKNQEGLVGLRLVDKKIRVGGQVIYTPDEDDDMDDSDPDDDLNL